MTPQKRRWDGCHFPHTCLFMLNGPWVTARPWQNKIRVPLCTSVSLSHGIGWQVSWGEERVHYTVCRSIFHLLLLCSRFLSIYPSLYFSHLLLHTAFITRFPSAHSLPFLVSLCLCFVSLSLPIHPCCLSPPPPVAALRGTKVKNTGRI